MEKVCQLTQHIGFWILLKPDLNLFLTS